MVEFSGAKGGGLSRKIKKERMRVEFFYKS
jgi:hypothetical protein